MCTKTSIATLVATVIALSFVFAPPAQAHEQQKSQPDPNQAPQSMGQGMTGEGMMGQGQGQGMMGQEVPMMPGMQRLMIPQMDPARGRKLFASKGCVACHAINGVGGHDATPLDAHTMKPAMNPFDFSAKMWRMAPAMIASQEEALGEQILFTGDEIADIIAFVHHDEEQHKFSEADIPPRIRKWMGHSHGEPGSGPEAHSEDLGHRHGEGEDVGHDNN
ncbi:MAG TPA: cytochrome c [Nitrospiraceae bacterium]